MSKGLVVATRTAKDKFGFGVQLSYDFKIHI